MSAVGLLIVFAVLGAVICAKTRAAGGAIAFALLALVLFIGTPLGQGLPGAVAGLMSTIDRATSPVLTDAVTPAAGGGER